jgi:LacI family transcriptional regulator
MGKVTMQDLADAVGVSRITVWKALNKRPGVSEEMRLKIQRKAVEIGYLPSVPAPIKAAAERTFSIVVSRPESSSFWMQIIHHIAKELAIHGINLMYTYMPTAYREGYALPSSLDAGSVDGFIVLNVYDENLLRLLTAQPLPKVFLDTVPNIPPRDLNGDLVLLEGRARICEITGKLLSSGRKRLGFIGDVNYAQTNMDRYQGFLDAHRAQRVSVDPALCMTGPISLRSHYEEISGFLSGITAWPDGFVCASDFIAHFVSQYLAESGRKCPAGFALTGFDNNPEYANVAGQITTVNVETAALGKGLARKLMFHADYPDAPCEVTYVATNILYRGELKNGNGNG